MYVFTYGLAVLARGNKLQYAPANYLLSKLVHMHETEDSPTDDEIILPGSQGLGKDVTLSQSMEADRYRERSSPIN